MHTSLLDVLRSAAFGLGLEVQADSDEVLQLSTVDGRLFTAYENAEPRWEWADGQRMADGSAAPDISSAFGWGVECRWEDLFCNVIEAVALQASDLLVVDGDGVVWRGTELDPATLRL